MRNEHIAEYGHMPTRERIGFGFMGLGITAAIGAMLPASDGSGAAQCIFLAGMFVVWIGGRLTDIHNDGKVSET